MRTYGKIESTFWQNPKVKNLTEDARLLLLYIYTTPHGNSIGTFSLPVGYISEDVGWTFERVNEHVTELVSKGFIEREETTKLTRIIGWFNHNTIENLNVAKAAIKTFDSLPDSQIKSNTLNALNELGNKFINELLNAFPNKLPNGFPNPNPTQPNLNLTYKTPSLPPKPVDNSAGVGVLKNEIGKDGDYDIISNLSESGLAASREAAPGWDIYHLASVYNSGAPERGIPKYPNKAFPEWCKRYTKGKQP